MLDALSTIRTVTALESLESLLLVDGSLGVDDFVELVVEAAVLELQLVDDLLELFLVVICLIQQLPQLLEVTLEEEQFLILEGEQAHAFLVLVLHVFQGALDIVGLLCLACLPFVVLIPHPFHFFLALQSAFLFFFKGDF